MKFILFLISILLIPDLQAETIRVNDPIHSHAPEFYTNPMAVPETIYNLKSRSVAMTRTLSRTLTRRFLIR